MKVRLNKRTIDEAVYQGPGGCYLWHTELSAFGVRIYPTGRKSFVVSYWSRGRRRFFTLGTYGKMTLHQARETALEVFLRVRRGEDPSSDRRATNQAPTVANLVADRHITEHAKIKNNDAGEAQEILVAVGKAAQARHGFRIGDTVAGEAVPVPDPRLETAAYYKVSKLKLLVRSASASVNPPPWTRSPPDLEIFREQGHRRLATRTYHADCSSCSWGCRMSVEMIIDH